MSLKAVKEVGQYHFSSNDKLFLDTNIWLFFYGPQTPRDHWVSVYSKAFTNILDAKSTIYIDVLIVSEFINTYARQKWKLVAKEGDQFKDFRMSTDFKQVAKDIADDVRRVLQHCSRLESGFETVNLEDLLSNYADGESDFNDQVIVELCKKEELTLVTHDFDFKGAGIPVLTANRRLLT